MLLKGSTETTTVTIKENNTSDTLVPVSGVNIKADIKYLTNNTYHFAGRTDQTGIYSHSWPILEGGKITVNIYADKSGYDPLSQHYNFTAYLDEADYRRSRGIGSLSYN